MDSIVLIIEGIAKVRGGTTKSFLGAAVNRQQVFQVCQDQSKREMFESFQISRYNILTNTYVGASETIYPYQEYTEDCHLVPEAKRTNGYCPQGLWGPFCFECRKKQSQELSQKFSKK